MPIAVWQWRGLPLHDGGGVANPKREQLNKWEKDWGNHTAKFWREAFARGARFEHFSPIPGAEVASKEKSRFDVSKRDQLNQIIT